MSRNQPIEVRGHEAWCLDNSLMIALAHVVEVLRRQPQVHPTLQEEVEHFAVHACVRDFHWEVPADWPEPAFHELRDAFLVARDEIAAHGPYRKSDLENWRLLPGHSVSAGHVRREVVPIEPIFEVIDWIVERLDGNVPPPADGARPAELGYF